MKDGEPVGGVQELDLRQGRRRSGSRSSSTSPRRRSTSTATTSRSANPGGKPLSFDFTADLDGDYELEAHGPDGDVVLAEIRVSP